MLVIFSDVHLTDESTAFNVHPTAFENIIESKIKENAQRKKAEEIHFVFLGDIYDMQRTDWWLRKTDPEDRPWNGKIDKKIAMSNKTNVVEQQMSAVLDGILETKSSRALTDMVRRLQEEEQIETRITYVVGNHDRYFYNFESLQKKLRANFEGIDIQFKNKLLAPEYGVLARHGQEWDENTHGWEFSNKVLKNQSQLQRFDYDAYKVMAIGEVLTAELMSGLIYNLKKQLGLKKGSNLKKNPDYKFWNNLKNVNNLRPITDVFHWIEWFTHKESQQREYKKYNEALRQSILDALKSTLNSKVAKLWDKMTLDILFHGDITDSLAKLCWAISKTKPDEFQEHLKMVLIILKLFNIDGNSADKHTDGALSEWKDHQQAKDMEDIQYVVYGHTHQAKRVYFSSDQNNKVRMYINTGTFLPLIQRTHDKKGFSTDYRMNIAFFSNPREDRDGRLKSDHGPTVDLWEGIKRKIYE